VPVWSIDFGKFFEGRLFRRDVFMTQVPDQSDSRNRKVIAFVVLAIVLFIGARTHADPDLWGHVRFGQDILKEGIPSTDPYSYLSAGYAWINHELLAEVSFGAAYEAFGVPGLVFLKVLLIGLMLSLVFWNFCRVGLNVLRAGIVLMLVIMLMSVGLWTLRPHLFTYLFFLLLLLLMDRAESGNQRALWFIPLVMLVWTNSHGGFLAGLGVLGIWTLAHFVMHWLPGQKELRGSAPSLGRLMIVLLSSGVATLINPYGADLLRFLLRTATVPRPEISEWQPVSITTPEGIAYIVVLGLSLHALIRSRRSPSFALIAVLIVAALLPLQALRHLPLFALSFAVLVGPYLGSVWAQPSGSDQQFRGGVLTVAGATLAAGFLIAAIPNFLCIKIDPDFVKFPARAVGLLERAQVQGNIATFFDWGEYMIWHLSPAIRVSIDGRRETVYSPDVYAGSLRFLYGVGNWDVVLDNPETDMALVGRDQPTYNLIRLKPDWQLVYEDATAGLFARGGSLQETALRSTPPPEVPSDGADLCFP